MGACVVVAASVVVVSTAEVVGGTKLVDGIGAKTTGASSGSMVVIAVSSKVTNSQMPTNNTSAPEPKMGRYVRRRLRSSSAVGGEFSAADSSSSG